MNSIAHIINKKSQKLKILSKKVVLLQPLIHWVTKKQQIKSMTNITGNQNTKMFSKISVIL